MKQFPSSFAQFYLKPEEMGATLFAFMIWMNWLYSRNFLVTSPEIKCAMNQHSQLEKQYANVS